MAANIWNPQAVLGIDLTENNFTCLGHTTRRNARCHNHIPRNDLDSASRMLDRIAQIPPANATVKELLREVAMSTHCRRNHRSNFNMNRTVRRWMATIDDMRNGQPGAANALNAAQQPGLQAPRRPVSPAVNGHPGIAATRGVHNLNIDAQPPGNAFEQAEADFRVELTQAWRMREQAALEAEARVEAPPGQEPAFGPQRGFFRNRNHHPPALNALIPGYPALPVGGFPNFSPVARSPGFTVRVTTEAPPSVRLDHIRNPRDDYRHFLVAAHSDSSAHNPAQTQAPVCRKSLTPGCPICYEKIEHLHDADWCQGTCGQNMHKECMRHWIDIKYGAGTYDLKQRSIDCCFCRGKWIWGCT